MRGVLRQMREKTREEVEKDRKTLIEIMVNELQRMPIEDVILFSDIMFWHTKQKEGASHDG